MTLTTACEPVRAMLPLFVGGDLEPLPAQAVREHLRACAPCRREAGAQLAAVHGLRRAAAAAVPGVDESMFADLHEGVMQRVEAMAPARTGVGQGWSGQGWSRWSLFRRAGVAAGALVLILGGWWLSGSDGGLLDRLPIRTADAAGGSSPGLQQLGHEPRQATTVQYTVEPPGLGLMGRLSLRTLEDEQVVLEPPVDPMDPTVPTAPTGTPARRR